MTMIGNTSCEIGFVCQVYYYQSNWSVWDKMYDRAHRFGWAAVIESPEGEQKVVTSRDEIPDDWDVLGEVNGSDFDDLLS